VTKISNIGNSFALSDDNSEVDIKKNTSTEKMFNYSLEDNKKGLAVIREEVSDEFLQAIEFVNILKSDELLDDDTLLLKLDTIKKLNLEDILDNFSLNSESGLLETILENPKIKQSTKDKYNNYIRKTLEKNSGFDRKYLLKDTKTTFKNGDFKYETDSYNVVQKDEHILEIENLNTKEKRTIDFRTLLEDANGFQSAAYLKSSIQKLPAEILFQIPKEVSHIWDKDLMESYVLEGEDREAKNFIADIGGMVANIDENHELVISTDDPATMIHELAHTFFANDIGVDVLVDNPKINKIYNSALENLKKDGKKPFDYENRIEGDEAYYWSNCIEDFGAETLTAVFQENYDALESLKKYAPDAFEAVLNVYEQRKASSDRHNHYTVEEFMNLNDDETE